MKYILLVFVIALLIFSNKMVSGSRVHKMAYESEDGDNTNETFSFAMNNFTLNLFQTLVNSSDENILFFPLNIARLLFMTYLGSDEHVASQIEKVLNAILHTSKFHTEIHNFFYEWRNPEKASIYTAIDKIYVASSVELRREYWLVLRMFYPNGLESVHFPEAVADINNLVKSRTHGLARSIGLEKDITSDTLLLLLSVVVLNGEWNAGLQSTTEESFLRDKDHSYSNSNFTSASLNYRKDEHMNCQMVELPIENGSTSLLLVIPSQRENFKNLMETINADILHSWINLEGFEKTQVVFQKLKLDLQCDLHLERILPKLGITDLFEKTGGLSKMSLQEDFFVNKFIQKSFLKIKAGAETGTGKTNLSSCGVVIQVNSPYFFFVVDKDTNMIISAGSIVDQQKMEDFWDLDRLF